MTMAMTAAVRIPVMIPRAAIRAVVRAIRGEVVAAAHVAAREVDSGFAVAQERVQLEADGIVVVVIVVINGGGWR
jgi:hypothetical protein